MTKCPLGHTSFSTSVTKEPRVAGASPRPPVQVQSTRRPTAAWSRPRSCHSLWMPSNTPGPFLRWGWFGGWLRNSLLTITGKFPVTLATLLPFLVHESVILDLQKWWTSLRDRYQRKTLFLVGVSINWWVSRNWQILPRWRFYKLGS